MRLIQPGLRAIHQHYRPFLLIQLLAVLLVLGYYRSTPLQAVCAQLIVIKAQLGLLFPMLSCAVAGAILPEIAKVLTTGNTHFPSARWRTMGFHFAFFAVNGVFVDYFYQYQTQWFGPGIDGTTLLKKMAVDMFVATPLWFAPFALTVFLWRHYRYDMSRTLRAWTPTYYRERVLPVLLPNWAYWIPMVLCIYAMPADLQFCLFLFAFAAWSLIFVAIATDLENALEPV